VVTNTTPILALSLIGQLDLLRALYHEVLAPNAVFSEVMAGGRGRVGTIELRQASWLHRVDLADPTRVDFLADLDRGEAEAIVLAQEVQADLLIVDERLARRYAQHLGIPITGTLGVLLRAKQTGLITEISPLIARLEEGGIRLGAALIRRALELAGEF
jgi:hypothetical protein